MILYLVLIVLALNLAAGSKHVNLLTDADLKGNTTWDNNCTVEQFSYLLHTTTNWTLDRNNYLVPTLDLAPEYCQLQQKIQSNFDGQWTQCVLTLRVASTQPESFKGTLQWQGKSTTLNDWPDIFSPANESVHYHIWTLYLGDYPAEDSTIRLNLRSQRTITTQWWVTNYVQIQCLQSSSSNNPNYYLIGGIIAGVVIIVSLSVLAICLYVKRKLRREKDYFNLNYEDGKKKKKQRSLCC